MVGESRSAAQTANAAAGSSLLLEEPREPLQRSCFSVASGSSRLGMVCCKEPMDSDFVEMHHSLICFVISKQNKISEEKDVEHVQSCLPKSAFRL